MRVCAFNSSGLRLLAIHLKSICLIGLTILLFTLMPNPSQAAGGDDRYGSSTEPSKLDPVLNAIEEEQFEKAIAKLKELDQTEPENADVLNLLGYSHRKLGRYDEALDYYTQALKVDPRHRGANEYLGELFLEMNQLSKAEERLAVLDDACFFTCKEFRTLKKAIKKHKAEKVR